MLLFMLMLLLLSLLLLFAGEYEAWMKKKAELQAAKQRMLVCDSFHLLAAVSIYRTLFYL